jgi:DNA-binding beta-propeller fold protein YncE
VIGTYRSGSFDAGASEIVAYDAKTYRAFAVNADDGTVDVLDISDPTSPTKVASLAAPGANSVAVERGLVAVAQEAETTTDLGTVSFFDASDLSLINEVTAGSLPDMVTFIPNGTRALVANEGEPEGYCPGQVDLRGSVSITIATWPVSGYYMPDGIDATRSRGTDYLVTANEGDAREYDCFEEEARVKELDLDPAAFPRAVPCRQRRERLCGHSQRRQGARA